MAQQKTLESFFKFVNQVNHTPETTESILTQVTEQCEVLIDTSGSTTAYQDTSFESLSESEADGEDDDDISNGSCDEIEHENCHSDCETASGRNICVSRCCDPYLLEPYQPKVDFGLTKKQQGKQTRMFCYGWFKDFNWLTFCTTTCKAFCFYCRSAHIKRLLRFQHSYGTAFTVAGFDNWKKAKQKFREHQRSRIHSEAVMKCKALLTQPAISTQLQSQLQNDQKKHSQALMKQLSSLQFLLHQGLAIRGHDENQSNLHQLLLCRSEDVPELSEWTKDKKYQSHDIVNELIQEMGLQLLRDLLNDIKKAKFYSIICDETRDNSGHEQLGISVRWVTENLEVNEDMIGLVEVEDTTASSLSSVIKDSLSRCGLALPLCVGQAYDGASNMSGHLTGVAAQIQKDHPHILYIHCLAHCLNLCLQDTGRNNTFVRDALNLTAELNHLIRASPKRLGLFQKIKDDLMLQSPRLKPLCTTRWTVRTGAIDAVIKNYNVICLELEEIGKTSSGEASCKASGLLALMEKFSTYFGLKLSHQIFAITEQLSRTLQYKSINAQEATLATRQAVNFLKRQRTDGAFQCFYSLVVEEAKDLTEEPTLPRQRQAPARYENGIRGHIFVTAESYYRCKYFEVYDLVCNEIQRRFQQKSLDVLREIESMIIDTCNGKSQLPSSQLEDYYTNIFDFPSLSVQLGMLPDLVRTTNETHSLGIKKVTSIQTVCELFNKCDFSKTMLSELSLEAYSIIFNSTNDVRHS